MTAERTALITGASGFVGAWLAAELLRNGYHVCGLGAPEAAPPERLFGFHAVGVDPDGATRYDGEAGSWSFEPGDILDPDVTAGMIARRRPDVIFHLAAQSSAGRSFADPAGTLAVNAGGVVAVLEAIRALDPGRRPVLVATGSADEYGAPEHGHPLHERSAIRPVSPYGASKAAQTLLCLQYHRAFGVPAIVTRAFSHTGPGQDERFLFPSVARRIVAAERGEGDSEILVGELSHRRDYLHVRDVVRAYRLAAEAGRAGEIYNVCSGRALPLAEGVSELCAAAAAPVTVGRDPDRTRPSDIPLLVGDGTKLENETGWKPETTIETALHELLSWCREE